MIDFKCPHCGAGLRVKDSAAGMNGKCKKCDRTIRVPRVAAAQNKTEEQFFGVPQEPTPQNEIEPQRRKAASVGEEEDARPTPPIKAARDHLVAIAVGGAGLTLLAVSAWLPWVKVFAGSVSGISGDGKFVFGLSLLIALTLAITARFKRFWTVGALAASAWGTICALWMGSLLYRTATFFQDKDMSANPFASMLATQLGPGIGLYAAPLAGLMVCAGFGYVVFQQAAVHRSWKDQRFLMSTQAFAVIVGLCLALLYVQPSNPTGQTRGDQNQPDADAKGDKEAKDLAMPNLNPFAGFADGFKARRRKALKAEIAESERKKNESARAAPQLRRFEVLRARFHVKKREYGMNFGDRIIELTVKNGAGHPVSRACFRGTLQTPGRTIPWTKGKFEYKIPGGLEPGEQAEWKIVLSYLSLLSSDANTSVNWFETEEQPDAVLHVEAIRLDGADGEPFLQGGFDDRDQKKLDSLKKQLSESN